jgi:hypothetical protein
LVARRCNACRGSGLRAPAFAWPTVAGSEGNYVLTPVKIGTYTARAQYQGFQTIQRRDITVQVQEQVAVDFTLEPGQSCMTR